MHVYKYMYALIISMPTYAGLGSHCFVLWLDEGTVTVVKRKQVQADVVVIGKEEDVVWHRNIKYRAKVAAIGMLHLCHSLNYLYMPYTCVLCACH